MFDDRRGLTQAVLTGRKTMTRRIIPEKYKTMVDAAAKGVLIVPLACIPNGLSIEEFAEQWSKQSGRMRVVPVQEEPQIQYVEGKDKIMDLSRYQVGEEVAIAQSYDQFRWPAPQRSDFQEILHSAGWGNKMFVKAELMPHRIKIADIRVEKLQDITEEDCLAEGIIKYTVDLKGMPLVKVRFGFVGCGDTFSSAREAFADLIDKISGKGTWNKNPWVFAYTFELVK